MWRKYKDLCGKSPISQYEAGENFIRVKFGKLRNSNGQFKPHKTYEWRAWSVGQEVIDEMKHFADYGCGLAKYIAKGFAKSTSRIY